MEADEPKQAQSPLLSLSSGSSSDSDDVKPDDSPRKSPSLTPIQAAAPSVTSIEAMLTRNITGNKRKAVPQARGRPQHALALDLGPKRTVAEAATRSVTTETTAKCLP